MQEEAVAIVWSEPQFAALVDALAADPDRREQLIDLLREDHAAYDQRGAATIVRMRGWILLTMARVGLWDAALVFVLEELDTGTDAYLVAAAARALRSYPRPDAAFAPFVMRAITNMRYRDEPLSFETYGEYATSSAGTSPLGELLATIAWLGPHARGVVADLEALRTQGGGLSRKVRIDLDRVKQAIRGADQGDTSSTQACCCGPPLADVRSRTSWAPDTRNVSEEIESVVLQDHGGESITFKEFFHGHPSIVAFFYTRCDNPLKCSLTITKLARVQERLQAQGLAERIRTAAISYDPAFDSPERLRVYGRDRGVRMDGHHRMLRAAEHNEVVRTYFELGVNFVGSLVNRHRVEVYILDAKGRIAASFERIHWDEQDVVTSAIDVLMEGERARAACDHLGPAPGQ